MKSLPYFRWFPGDAETDAAYTSLSLSERGLFHLCLNMAWMNEGLPDDTEEIRRALRLSEQEFNSAWPRVSKCFVLQEGRFVNRRQEEERTHATSTSEKRAASAKQMHSKRSANAEQMQSKCSARAYESESVSESVVLNFPKPKPQEPENSSPSARFEEFWGKYPRKVGVGAARGDWNSVVTVENEDLVFACLDRYLASKDVASGAVMNAGSGMRDIGWIMKCSQDRWTSDWPKVRDPPAPKLTPTQVALKMALEEEARDAART